MGSVPASNRVAGPYRTHHERYAMLDMFARLLAIVLTDAAWEDGQEW